MNGDSNDKQIFIEVQAIVRERDEALSALEKARSLVEAQKKRIDLFSTKKQESSKMHQHEIDNASKKIEKLESTIKSLRNQRDSLKKQLSLSRFNSEKLAAILRRQRDTLRKQLSLSRVNSEKLAAVLRRQRDANRNRFILNRDIFTQKLQVLRSQRDIYKYRAVSIGASFSIANSQISAMLEDTFLKGDPFGFTVYIASNLATKKSFSCYKNAIRNLCGFYLDSPAHQSSELCDYAKILMGIINFNSGIEYGSYTYFKQVCDERLLLKYCPGLSLCVFAIYDLESYSRFYNLILGQIKSARIYLSSSLYLDIIKAISIANHISSDRKIPQIKQALNELGPFHCTDKDGDSDKLKWSLEYPSRDALGTTYRDVNRDSTKIVNIGVMDYKMIDLDYCSGNLGDYVQTLASILAWKMAVPCKFTKTTFISNSVTQIFDELDQPLKEHNSSQEANLQLNPVIIDRDSSLWAENCPAKTWFVCNGWYRHTPFGSNQEFGFHDNVIPIFISFHINKPSLLSPTVVNYLKRFEPIGCRDWTTVILLKSQNISAFFSGCLTSTIGDLFPTRKTNFDLHAEAFVEASGDDGLKYASNNFSQVGEFVKIIAVEDGLSKAYEMLWKYRDYARIYTSRLHCYLPCASMGLNVVFKPKNQSDQRYPGLFPISSSNFALMRARLRENLNSTLAFISRQNPTVQQYLEHWNNIWNSELSAANDYYNNAKSFKLKESTIDIERVVNILQASSVSSVGFSSDHEPTIHLAFGFDHNLVTQFEITLLSIIKNTNSRLQCYILGRGLDQEWIHCLISKYSAVHFKFYDMTVVDYGDNIRTLSHITQSTMDRLFLAKLINVDKVMYLDTDLIVRCNLLEIWGINIENHFMAGVPSIFGGWKDVMTIVFRTSKLLSPNDANDLRNHCMTNFPSSLGKNYNAGVLLMNLDMMRSICFTENSLTFVEHYCLNDQDILTLFSNGKVLELPKEYNYVPTQSFLLNPKIVHWAGPRKPWKDNVNIQFKSEYMFYASLVNTNNSAS